MLVRTIALSGLLLATEGCDRPTSPAPPTRFATSTPSVVTPELSEAQALARVQALPEVKALAQQVTGEGKQERKKRPRVRVLTAPSRQSTSSEEDSHFWELIVADEARFEPDGTLSTAEPADLQFRVEASSGALSVLDFNGRGYRDYAAWSAAQRGWERAAALVMSTPEWEAQAKSIRSSREAREVGAELGLVYAEEPHAGCVAGATDCRYALSAMRTCGSCAGGLWVDFAVDVARQAVFVSGFELPAAQPYGTWRQQFRAQVRADAQFRALVDPHQAFPLVVPGAGPLGYGVPERGPSAASLTIAAALERGGFAHVRTERYAHGFLVYVVRRTNEPSALDLRGFGSELVRANGMHACEIVVDGVGERFQFDRYALKGVAGGVYSFIDGAFQPWLAREGG